MCLLRSGSLLIARRRSFLPGLLLALTASLGFPATPVSAAPVAKVTPPPVFDVKAPAGAPNVMIILIDDMGFCMPSTFVPIMEGMAGLFVDRQKSLAVSAWYQATLSQPAASEFYKYGVGMGLAYFFDW